MARGKTGFGAVAGQPDPMTASGPAPLIKNGDRSSHGQRNVIAITF
ncbi:hypothetical protein LA76x_1386 [Lysobacter antibioticus]|uniref:Uncharacterized protein n=1 Tax=Lysobacter antibioticus TaxID=84531 RepID=A0A0S2F7L3_LYSAN|nr:hypothetical protein LA76x_1386 [Lysobacter antibioticus]